MPRRGLVGLGPWGIRRQPQYQEELAALAEQVPRAEEFARGVEHVLSRDPRTGRMVVEMPPVWCITTPDVEAAEPMTIYYTFHADEARRRVFLMSVRKDSPVAL